MLMREDKRRENEQEKKHNTRVKEVQAQRIALDKALQEVEESLSPSKRLPSVTAEEDEQVLQNMSVEQSGDGDSPSVIAVHKVALALLLLRCVALYRLLCKNTVIQSAHNVLHRRQVSSV